MTPPSRSHHRLTPADPIAAFAHVRFDAPRAYADLDLALALAWQVIEGNGEAVAVQMARAFVERSGER